MSCSAVCDAAELLLRNVPDVSAPSALKCNAALAIELFLKSLDSHWVHHALYDEMDDDASTLTTEPNADEMNGDDSAIPTEPNRDEMDDDAYTVTTKANVQEHRLNLLFDALPKEIQEYFTAEFQANPLCGEHESLRSVLMIYGNAFVAERYSFENKHDSDRRPIGEIVKLARFFREVVDKILRKRYWSRIPDPGLSRNR